MYANSKQCNNTSFNGHKTTSNTYFLSKWQDQWILLFMSFSSRMYVHWGSGPLSDRVIIWKYQNKAVKMFCKSGNCLRTKQTQAAQGRKIIWIIRSALRSSTMFYHLHMSDCSKSGVATGYVIPKIQKQSEAAIRKLVAVIFTWHENNKKVQETMILYTWNQDAQVSITVLCTKTFLPTLHCQFPKHIWSNMPVSTADLQPDTSPHPKFEK